MRLARLHVKNYRNLADIVVHLDPYANYLIGENNIGKSNLIRLIACLTGNCVFEEADYGDPDSPIRVEMDIERTPDEDGRARLRILCAKRIADAQMTCQDMDSGHAIDRRVLWRLNFFRAEASRGDSVRGADVGAFLARLRDMRLGEAAQPGPAPDAAQLRSRLAPLLDAYSLSVQRAGIGVQSSAVAMMNILNRVLWLYHSRSMPLAEMARRTGDGKRILPLVMALDEPEIHLHPYMQRSLIRYYKRLLSNQDAAFLALLKACFDLDGLDGQLLIVTHSTDALVDNFRNLIRFYKDASGVTRAVSGSALQIAPGIEKHLLMQFPDIKEAFYARCALLVEGTTESSSIRLFADTLQTPTDDFGICVIDSGGEGSLKKLESLLTRFAIPCVLVFDGDVRQDKEARDNEFYTPTPCYEAEITAALIEAEDFETLESIPPQLQPDTMEQRLSYQSLEKALHKLGAPNMAIPRTLKGLRRKSRPQYETIYAAWLYRNKGAMLGRVIGRSLPARSIPACYRDAIYRARDISTGAAAQSLPDEG